MKFILNETLCCILQIIKTKSLEYLFMVAIVKKKTEKSYMANMSDKFKWNYK